MPFPGNRIFPVKKQEKYRFERSGLFPVFPGFSRATGPEISIDVKAHWESTCSRLQGTAVQIPVREKKMSSIIIESRSHDCCLPLN